MVFTTRFTTVDMSAAYRRRPHDNINATDEAAARFAGLWAVAESEFRLGANSVHGPDHWRRVEQNATLLAAETGADLLVVCLFAVLHDARRQGESTDAGHGPRAAAWAGELRGEYFELDDDRFELLVYACAWHDAGQVSSDPTVGTCWDADRLDLPRVGITPDPALMSTEFGRLLAMRPRRRW